MGYKTACLIVSGIVLLFACPAIGSTITYEYDDLNRLIEVRYPDGVVILYTYDAVGNRQSKTVNLDGLKGDINGDCLVNQTDANLALQVLAGKNPPGIRSDYASSGADINGDNRIGMQEVIYILEKLRGLRP